MFSKILIANRGEIACRILKTARRMGVRSVAVYSEADAAARHVRHSDEAVAIGGAAARDSYLSIGRILDAAARSGAQAIHPGYGFLAENAEFAEACAAAGIVFVGPPAAAIRTMGSKAAAKQMLERAGVPLVPGYHGEDQEPSFLRAQAQQIGYPLLIKASSGGGGKGMRVVASSEDFDTALASCRREASAAFGDDRVILEKYLLRPRHIEIQVFADTHGNAVHLFERDCSVQRRHQKVLEEAPAPAMTSACRAAMAQAAIDAARAVGYVGAGTVEFIAGPDFAVDGAFYFMEMNTRLQVEHPVTEMVTGLDLVEWQLRVASGEPLPLAQEQIAIRGHAIEARVYAEDPERGFLPSVGRLVHLAAPAESLHVRIDSGVEQGDEITPYYDPMIAKLVVWDETRERAAGRMLHALAQFRIVGVANNVEFLSRLTACPAFAMADLDTGLIEREHRYLLPQADEPPRDAFLLAALAELLREDLLSRRAAAADADPHSPWHLRDGWRLNSRARRSMKFRAGEREITLAVAYARRGFEITDGEQTTVVHGELGENNQVLADWGGRRFSATVIAAGEKRHVFLDGQSYQLAAVDPLFHAGEGGGGDGGLTAPMPGKVIALLAEVGAALDKGAPLLILEAMKMEHTISAPVAGRVGAFHFGVGEQVGEGAELLNFIASGEPDALPD